MSSKDRAKGVTGDVSIRGAWLFHVALVNVVACVFFMTQSVYAQTYEVNSDLDIDSCEPTFGAICTLRGAIKRANGGGGTIVFNIETLNVDVDRTITLDSPLPNITTPAGVTINGGGITINGNNAVRVFEVNSGAMLTLQSKLTITNGNAGTGNGGGILNNCALYQVL